jgi:release factor glutamine methyltransferase
MLQQTYQVAPQWDLIVSNPPYICDSEAEQMEANVLDYEPEIALFVPDDDPLQFYVPIMNYAQSALHPGGQLWLETNPLYEEIIEERLLELGFNVTAHDDQFGKTRFIQAIR